jgi:type I restriction-modification system DNA methylase subunit
LDQSGVIPEHIGKLRETFGFIRLNASMTDEAEGKQFVEELVSRIDREINTFIQTHKYFDAISQFYIEFLKYANADRGLGIVLTPSHITDLFCDLADVNKDSVVFDNCCGTGGFLISAMRKMMREAEGDKDKKRDITERQLVGIEYQPDIYALLISNMIIHGDGKTSMYQGDCFKMSKKMKDKYSPNVGLLNPPYKTKGTPVEELEFVLNNLDVLDEGSKCVALLPMTCVTETSGIIKELKRRMVEKHTLEGVMSLPVGLFHGQSNVVTCAMVVTAHKPHPIGKKTWFGYWRDDGFVLVKNKGRVDKNLTWESTKSRWVNALRNRELMGKVSVAKEVKETDEWCAEAYMETDYSELTEADFTEVVKKYVSYRFREEWKVQ